MKKRLKKKQSRLVSQWLAQHPVYHPRFLPIQPRWSSTERLIEVHTVGEFEEDWLMSFGNDAEFVVRRELTEQLLRDMMLQEALHIEEKNNPKRPWNRRFDATIYIFKADMSEFHIDRNKQHTPEELEMLEHRNAAHQQ